MFCSCRYHHPLQFLQHVIPTPNMHVDLLTSLPYVDVDNVGVCGCSGGGTQSAYLASVDRRIKAASIACYMSTILTDYEYVYGGEYDGVGRQPVIRLTCFPRLPCLPSCGVHACAPNGRTICLIMCRSRRGHVRPF